MPGMWYNILSNEIGLKINIFTPLPVVEVL